MITQESQLHFFIVVINLFLYATTFRWTTTIMRQRSDVYNLRNFNTSTVDSTNSTLTAVSRSFHISFYLAQAQVICYLCAILSGHLSCVRSILL